MEGFYFGPNTIIFTRTGDRHIKYISVSFRSLVFTFGAFGYSFFSFSSVFLTLSISNRGGFDRAGTTPNSSATKSRFNTNSFCLRPVSEMVLSNLSRALIEVLDSDIVEYVKGGKVFNLFSLVYLSP